MQFPNIEKLLDRTKDNPLQSNIFNQGALGGEDQVDFWVSDEWLDLDEYDEPLTESVLSLSGYAYGMLTLLDCWAEMTEINPKITVAQAKIVWAFEADIERGWVADWGLTPDIVRPPKGDGWSKYLAAKQAVGL